MNEAMLRPANHLPVPLVILLKLSSFSRPRSHLGSTSELFPLLLILQVTVDTCSLTPSRLMADEVRAGSLHPVLSVFVLPVVFLMSFCFSTCLFNGLTLRHCVRHSSPSSLQVGEKSSPLPVTPVQQHWYLHHSSDTNSDFWSIPHSQCTMITTHYMPGPGHILCV